MARKRKPSEPIRNAPTKPGFYWAIWTKASPKTVDGDELTPEKDWGIVEVFPNHIGKVNAEQFGVFVPGVREVQWLDCFVWGPGIQKPDLARYCRESLRKATVEEAIETFHEADELDGFEHRGYPACVGHLNGVVAVADDTGENGSSLNMYNAQEFIDWMSKAKEGVESGKFNDIQQAINETRIEAKVSDGH